MPKSTQGNRTQHSAKPISKQQPNNQETVLKHQSCCPADFIDYTALYFQCFSEIL